MKNISIYIGTGQVRRFQKFSAYKCRSSSDNGTALGIILFVIWYNFCMNDLHNNVYTLYRQI